MSRVTSPSSSSQSQSSGSSTQQVQIPREKIAQRAYEKWCQRGCPHGSDKQDWMDAETELRAEVTRGSSSASSSSARPTTMAGSASGTTARR